MGIIPGMLTSFDMLETQQPAATTTYERLLLQYGRLSLSEEDEAVLKSWYGNPQGLYIVQNIGKLTVNTIAFFLFSSAVRRADRVNYVTIGNLGILLLWMWVNALYHTLGAGAGEIQYVPENKTSRTPAQHYQVIQDDINWNYWLRFLIVSQTLAVTLGMLWTVYCGGNMRAAEGKNARRVRPTRGDNPRL